MKSSAKINQIGIISPNCWQHRRPTTIVVFRVQSAQPNNCKL